MAYRYGKTILKHNVLTNNSVAESKIGILPHCIQTRHRFPELKKVGAKDYWPEWTMIKDQRKRMVFKEHGVYKVRLNAIRKNDILPPEIREIADQEIAAVPIDASVTRIVNRCCLTSRPRGTVNRWRLSRIVFRHLADYNKLSGVMRGIWM